MGHFNVVDVAKIGNYVFDGTFGMRFRGWLFFIVDRRIGRLSRRIAAQTETRETN